MGELKRKRRIPRWVFIGIVIALILFGPFTVCRVVIHQRMESALAAILAEGQPASLAQLDAWYVEPPPGENAAVFYQAAFDKYWEGADPDEPPLPVVGEGVLPARGERMSEEMLAQIEQYLWNNGASLELLEQAATLRACRFPVRFATGYAALSLPHLAKLRQGARLLWLQAVVAAENGDAETATAAICTSFALARSAEQEPILISQLVAIACRSVTRSSMEYVLNRIPLSDDQLKRISTAAGNENSQRWMNALIGERAMAVDTIRFQCANSPAGQVFREWSGWADADASVYLRVMNNMIGSYQLPFPQQLASELPRIDAEVEGLPKLHMVVRLLMPALSAAEGKHAGDIARLRITQTVAAVERYRLENHHLPGSLGELAPKYLAAVPEDPFDSKPLRYRLTEKGYLIYSINYDLKDDNGLEPQKDPTKPTPTVWDITFIVERPGPE